MSGLSDHANKEQLIQASLLALGWIVGRSDDGIYEPVALPLAIALRGNKVESTYIERIIRMQEKPVREDIKL